VASMNWLVGLGCMVAGLRVWTCWWQGNDGSVNVKLRWQKKVGMQAMRCEEGLKLAVFLKLMCRLVMLVFDLFQAQDWEVR